VGLEQIHQFIIYLPLVVVEAVPVVHLEYRVDQVEVVPKQAMVLMEQDRDP
jgi:hypothetical protein